MKRIGTAIEIDATADEAWDVLMDFASYPSWNPMVVAIAGEPVVGSSLRTTIALRNGRSMSFTPVVVEYDARRRFAWLGHLIVRGLFDGCHFFEVQQHHRGVTFLHGEEFRGVLVPLLGGVLKETRKSMEAMNNAIVQEVVRRKTADARIVPASAFHAVVHR